MSRKRPFIILPILAVTAACGCLGGMGCGDSADHSHTPPPQESGVPAAVSYTCTMHPDVISTTPGKCPKCGMKLVVKA